MLKKLLQKLFTTASEVAKLKQELRAARGQRDYENKKKLEYAVLCRELGERLDAVRREIMQLKQTGGRTYTLLPQPQDICFHAGDQKILEIKENGDIFVKGRFTENDKEVVAGLREWLKLMGY